VCLGTDTLPNIPLLVLCTSDVPEKLLPHDVASLFTHTHPLHYPDEEARRAFWAHFVDDVAQPPPDVAKRKKRALAVLPKAPIQPALQKVTQVEPLPDSLARPPATHTPHTTVVLTSLPQEDEQRKRVEDHYLRKLRMRFRECILSLLRERRFQPFYKPVVPTLTLALWPLLSFRRWLYANCWANLTGPAHLRRVLRLRIRPTLRTTTKSSRARCAWSRCWRRSTQPSTPRFRYAHQQPSQRFVPCLMCCRVCYSLFSSSSTQAFLADVQLIRANAEEYNPRDDPHFLISKVREACSTLLLVLGLND
jgi:hypothetical protein